MTAVATLVAPDPLLGVLGDTSRLAGLTAVVLVGAAFVLATSIPHHELRVVVFGLLAGAAVVVAGGLAQMLGVIEHSGRVTSTMGNAEFLGAYLCIAVPVVVALALDLPSARAWTLPLLAGSIAVLVGTQTRGAWVGAAAGVALVLVVARPRWRVFAVAAAVVVVAAAVVAPVRGHGDPGSPGTAQGRLDTWRITARVVEDRPVLGWGPEGFRNAFARAMDRDWVQSYGLRQLPDRAHNRFLDVAATTGGVGLAVDIGLLLVTAAALRRALRDATRRPFVVAAAGALAGWLVQGQFFFDTFDVSVVLWVMLGAVLARDAAALPRPRVGSLAVPVVAAIVLVAGYSVVADRKVQHSEGRAPQAAFVALDDAIRLRPRSLDAYLALGAAARRSADADLLRAAHARLSDWDDDEVRFADARVLIALGDATSDRRPYAAAETALRAILRHRPYDSRVRSVLAILTR